jgi:predicted dehydrogenase
VREIRVGLIGAGWMGKAHAMAYRTARQAFGPEPATPVLAVVADPLPGAAERAATSCGFDLAVPNWRAVVEDPGIDIVDICTPNDSHCEIATAALAAGKHVYCEKPLANSAEEAWRMAQAAAQAGATTLIGFNYIQNPVHRLAREAIARGEVGELRYARLYFNSDFMADPMLQHTWRNDAARAGSGVIGDIGAHCLSYLFHLIPQVEVAEVLCTLETVIPDHPAPLSEGAFRAGAAGDASRRIPNTTDDMATVLLRFAGGGSGHMEMSRVATGVRFDVGYDLIGTRGSVRYRYDRINDISFYRDGGPAELRGFTQVQMGPTDPGYAALLPIPGIGLGYNDHKAIEAREMITAVAEGRPAYPDFAFGYRVQRVVEACLRSHRARAWVKPGEIA